MTKAKPNQTNPNACGKCGKLPEAPYKWTIFTVDGPSTPLCRPCMLKWLDRRDELVRNEWGMFIGSQPKRHSA